MSDVQVDGNVDQERGSAQAGDGARFWVYVAGHNDTGRVVTWWSVTIRETGGDWVGTITSDDPRRELRTPGLSGVFEVTVTASGPRLPATTLAPLPDSRPDLGCRADCAAMVGIVATEDGTGANYWTAWDAFCPD